MDIASVSAVIAAFGVIIGVILAILELRNITKTRQMELIMSIYSRLSTREFLEAWDKMRAGEFKDYDGCARKQGLVDLNIVGWVFEGLGFLLHRGFLDIDTVRELMSESTKMTWEKVKPMAEDVRKQLNRRKSGEYIPIYKWWEYLYNELQKREQTLQAPT